MIPPITRSAWEPPALEVLDKFEVNHFSFFHVDDDKFKAKIPHAEVRLQILDLMCELYPLGVYAEWVGKTQEATNEAEDQRKVDFMMLQ